jgi:hypothetical protein
MRRFVLALCLCWPALGQTVPLEEVVRGGQPAAGIPGATYSDSGLAPLGVANNNHVFFQARLNGVDQSADTGIFVWSSGVIRLALREGQPLPEVCPDCVVGNVRVARLDDSGRVMASVDARSGNAVVANAVVREAAPGDLRVLAFTGGPAPLREGETITTADFAMDMAPDGTGVILVSTTDDSAASQVVYVIDDAGLRILTESGVPSIARPEWIYRRLSSARGLLALNGGGAILHAYYEGSPPSGFERISGDSSLVLAYEGEPIPEIHPLARVNDFWSVGSSNFGDAGIVARVPPATFALLLAGQSGTIPIAWSGAPANEVGDGHVFSGGPIDSQIIGDGGHLLFKARTIPPPGGANLGNQLWSFDPDTAARRPVTWDGANLKHADAPARGLRLFGMDARGRVIFEYDIPSSGGLALWTPESGRRSIIESGTTVTVPGGHTGRLHSLYMVAMTPPDLNRLETLVSGDGRFAFWARFHSLPSQSPPHTIAFSAIYTATIPNCDFIDFNLDGLTPDVQDLADFLAVFSGGLCAGQQPGDAPCNADIDFNNDGLAPDNADIEALFTVFGGGNC